MPNWCENDLNVTGPPEEVKRFLDFAKSQDTDFDFNKFVPYPEKYRLLDQAAAHWEAVHPDGPWQDRPKDGFNQGGYEWCHANWGTKWNAGEARVEPDGDDGAMIHFSTAWSPPSPVVLAASALFPALEFDLRYYECGCAFHGVYRCKAGDVLQDKTGNYYGNRGG